MYLTIAPNTTYCPDTPENWRNFERLKAELLSGGTRSGSLDQKLQARIRAENKKLRSYSTYLPGYEPD